MVSHSWRWFFWRVLGGFHPTSMSFLSPVVIKIRKRMGHVSSNENLENLLYTRGYILFSYVGMIMNQFVRIQIWTNQDFMVNVMSGFCWTLLKSWRDLDFPVKNETTAGGVADDELGSSKRNRWLVVFFSRGKWWVLSRQAFQGHIVCQKFWWLQDISSTKTSKFYRVLPSPSIEVVATTYITVTNGL